MVAIIDAHQHCWQLGQHDCTWPTPEFEAIYRDFSPPDFAAEALALGVTGSVLVQSQESLADTRYLLQQAAEHPHILGVVGWVDLASADALEQIPALATDRHLKGLRPMLQNLIEDDWIVSRALPEALATMSDCQLSFDALVYSRHLPGIKTLAERHPQLPIVLDHAAKPAIGKGEWQYWRQGLATLASHPNVCCKLSGLITEMAPRQHWQALLAYIREILTLFGPERVLWGSDWPVLQLAGDYDRWLSYSWQAVQQFSPGCEEAVFADNARRFYCLP